MNIKHSERVLEATREQLGRLVHTDYTVAPYGIYPEVAERLVGLMEGAGKAAFFNCVHWYTTESGCIVT